MKKQIMIIFISIFLAACAGPSKKTLLPDQGPTTKEVYEGHMGGNYDFSKNATTLKSEEEPWDTVTGNRILPRNQGQSSLVARELDAIKRDFSKVNNPEIVGYVFPHLSTNNHPVPGYFTAFSLYSGEHYAITRSEGEIHPLRALRGD